MKTFKEDKELKSLLKSVKLESPNSDFSVKVMNRIFAEESLFEKIRKERILGKGFWIIMVLFITLFAAIFVFNTNEVITSGGFSEYIPGLDTNTVTQDYQNFFQKLDSLPVSIAGIFLASSILIFLERILNSKIKPYSKQAK